MKKDWKPMCVDGTVKAMNYLTIVRSPITEAVASDAMKCCDWQPLNAVVLMFVGGCPNG